MQQQGFKNFVFRVKQVINNRDLPDVWIVFSSEKDMDKYYSLKKLLWRVNFDP